MAFREKLAKIWIYLLLQSHVEMILMTVNKHWKFVYRSISWAQQKYFPSWTSVQLRTIGIPEIRKLIFIRWRLELFAKGLLSLGTLQQNTNTLWFQHHQLLCWLRENKHILLKNRRCPSSDSIYTHGMSFSFYLNIQTKQTHKSQKQMLPFSWHFFHFSIFYSIPRNVKEYNTRNQYFRYE